MSDLMLLGVLRMPRSDDVTKLEAMDWVQLKGRIIQAADELELRADRIAELEKALEPFAKACNNNIDCDADKWRDSDHLWESSAAMDITAGDLRVAKAAICGGGGQK